MKTNNFLALVCMSLSALTTSVGFAQPSIEYGLPDRSDADFSSLRDKLPNGSYEELRIVTPLTEVNSKIREMSRRLWVTNEQVQRLSDEVQLMDDSIMRKLRQQVAVVAYLAAHAGESFDAVKENVLQSEEADSDLRMGFELMNNEELRSLMEKLKQRKQ